MTTITAWNPMYQTTNLPMTHKSASPFVLAPFYSLAPVHIHTPTTALLAFFINGDDGSAAQTYVMATSHPEQVGQWSLPSPLMNSKIITKFTPAATWYKGMSVLAITDPNDAFISIYTSTDPLATDSWELNVQLANDNYRVNTLGGPGIVANATGVFLAYRGDPDTLIYLNYNTSSDLDENSWRNPSIMLNGSFNTITTPALTTFNGQLVLAYLGLDSPDNIFITSQSLNNLDQTWPSSTRMTQTLSAAPPVLSTLLDQNNNQYVCLSYMTPTGSIVSMGSVDLVNWSKIGFPIPTGSDGTKSPGMALFDAANSVFLAYPAPGFDSDPSPSGVTELFPRPTIST